MLKIKSDIDLKELEKYGLYKTETYFGFVYTDKNIGVYIEEKYNRKIDTWDYPGCTDLDEYNDILYDLIKDGLVEKVEE